MDKQSWAYLAIVGIVAIVAVVVLVMNFSGRSATDSSTVVGEQGNVVGEAGTALNTIVIKEDCRGKNVYVNCLKAALDKATRCTSKELAKVNAGTETVTEADKEIKKCEKTKVQESNKCSC